MHRAVIFSAVVLLVGCKEHMDPSGTYVGDGDLSYSAKEGKTTSVPIPNETITVTLAARHYQYSSIDVVARGCRIKTPEGGGSLTRWPLSSRGCELDIPSVGKVKIDLSGGLDRKPDTTSTKVEQVHLVLYGTTADGATVKYAIDAKPKAKSEAR